MVGLRKNEEIMAMGTDKEKVDKERRRDLDKRQSEGS